MYNDATTQKKYKEMIQIIMIMEIKTIYSGATSNNTTIYCVRGVAANYEGCGQVSYHEA